MDKSVITEASPTEPALVAAAAEIIVEEETKSENDDPTD